MEREETKKVLKIMATAYPRYFGDMSRDQKIDQINLYHSMLEHYPADAVVVALHNYIAKNEYPPSIAGLKKQIDLLMPEQNNTVQLWNELAKACRRGSVMTEEGFDALPEPVKQWCGNVTQIRELSQMDASTFNSVIRGQFLKTVPVIIERQEAVSKLPESVRQALEKATTKMIGGSIK